MAGSRQIFFSYGSWTTSATDCTLTGVHDVSMDERTFRCQFDVAIHGGNSLQLQTAYETMTGQLNQRHLPFYMSVGGTRHYDFVDGADGTVASGIQEGAEFIKADWKLLEEHRTEKSRAYQITITVTRAAKQTGKIGVYDQSIRLTTAPTGKRRLYFRAQFTPGPINGETGTAEDRYADATYGFVALATAITTALTGTWEQASSITKSYDEDSRTLTASTTYTELIFDQDGENRNSATLIGANYDIRLDRKSAFGIPGKNIPKGLSAATVSFSCGVDIAGGRDLKEVIETDIIPYVSFTVSKKLLQTGVTPKLLKHTLKADYVNNRVAGTLFYLVEETTILEMSKRASTQYRRGITLIPVLDGKEFTRDMHTGPGRQTLNVVLGARVLGRSAAFTVKQLEKSEVIAANKAGYIFMGYGTTYSPSTEYFWVSGEEIETTIQTTTLRFEKATIRPPRNIASPLATQQRQVINVGNSSFEDGDGAALKRAQDAIKNQLSGGF